MSDYKYYTGFMVMSLLLFCGLNVSAQDLENIPPVTSDASAKDSQFTFLFNTIDFHKFKNLGPQVYENTIQIVDADTPWPPRWYTSVPMAYTDSLVRYDSIHQLMRGYLLFDAKPQGDKITFYKQLSVINTKTNDTSGWAGYIICDKNMEAIDTLKTHGRERLFFHDFRMNDKNERIALVRIDTSLDLRQISGNKKDSLVSSEIDLIQIFDSTGTVVFNWNPVKFLGVNSFKYADGRKRSFSGDEHKMDWSHGTGCTWDFDGDILYSYRHIGVGKFSRKDGHIIWRIDWNKMPIVRGKDTIEFYEQHDFENIKEDSNQITYSVYSLGTDEHPKSLVQFFSVDKKTLRLNPGKKIMPEHHVWSNGAGNFDPEENGNYLLHYGLYPGTDHSDTSHVFMEYRIKNGGIIRLKLPSMIFAYKAHRLISTIPPRPSIRQQGDVLIASGSRMKNWTWYKLEQKKKHKNARKVGSGESYIPTENGKYCVSAEYGIGYAVSVPVTWKK
jgi:hypothetical protein